MEGNVILTVDEFEDYVKDSEICRVLRDCFSKMENVSADYVRAVLEVEYKGKELQVMEIK